MDETLDDGKLSSCPSVSYLAARAFPTRVSINSAVTLGMQHGLVPHWLYAWACSPKCQAASDDCSPTPDSCSTSSDFTTIATGEL